MSLDILSQAQRAKELDQAWNEGRASKGYATRPAWYGILCAFAWFIAGVFVQRMWGIFPG